MNRPFHFLWEGMASYRWLAGRYVEGEPVGCYCLADFVKKHQDCCTLHAQSEQQRSACSLHQSQSIFCLPTALANQHAFVLPYCQIARWSGNKVPKWCYTAPVFEQMRRLAGLYAVLQCAALVRCLQKLPLLAVFGFIIGHSVACISQDISIC